MNIAGLLVHAHPARRDAVRRRLAGLSGVEVHAASQDGRLIVTVEDTDDAPAADTVLALHRMEGVLSAAIVYHHFEPLSEVEETREKADATDPA
jgi:nitrate reductase NapD